MEGAGATQTPLGQVLLGALASLARARWALAETLLSPPKQCSSPSQGQQEAGQGADSAEETSWLPSGLPGLGLSLHLAANGFAV